MWTVFDPPTLATVSKELAALTESQVRALPSARVTDDLQWADETRAELWRGLKQLRAWVKEAQQPERAEILACAKRGNSLLLSMDGDQ